MIDPETEEIVSLTAATKSLPSRPNITTLWRWRSRGIAGIRLETIAVGGRTFTSREALTRFFERVTAAKSGRPIRARTTRQRETQQRAARRQLQDAGLLD